jgi:putative MATE family efflux protein
MGNEAAVRVTPLSAAPPAAAATGSYRQIWSLAWPVSISTSTVTLLTLVNLFWIGHLGTVAVAAVSICGNILFIVFGISNIVYTGTLAIVARRVGEGSLSKAFAASLHAVLLGVGLGLVVVILGHTTAPAVVAFFGAGHDVETLATSYLRIMYLGQLPLYVTVALGACYQAGGDTRTPMLVNVAVVVANAVADPFFIFSPAQVRVAGVALGWFGWGVDGAAIAATLCGFAGCALFLTVSAVSRRPFRRPAHERVTLAAQQFWLMLRIGTPASISMIARPLSTFLLLKVVASFGTAAIAAFGIAIRSFSVNWIPYSGMSVAISSLVGQSLGARDAQEAQRVVRRGLVITTVLGIFFCMLYYGWATDIMRAFDNEPAVVAAGQSFLKLIALSFLFSGPMFPLASGMNGAGDTKPPMIAAFLANWPVKLPLAYVLAVPLGYGVDGVWLGMFISIVFEAIVMFLWYRRGTWLQKRL